MEWVTGHPIPKRNAVQRFAWRVRCKVTCGWMDLRFWLQQQHHRIFRTEHGWAALLISVAPGYSDSLVTVGRVCVFCSLEEHFPEWEPG